MTDRQALVFRRLSKPDADGLIRIQIRAQNSILAAMGEGLTSAKSLVAFADTLNCFPTQLSDSTSFSAVGCGCDVAINLKTLDGSGHVGVNVSIQEEAHSQGSSATLWLKTEPTALLDLARQLRRLVDLSADVAELPT
jgi:hypothetical protein